MYDDKGQLTNEGNLKDDKAHGLWKLYENGQIIKSVIMTNGERISEKCWDKKGNKIECE